MNASGLCRQFGREPVSAYIDEGWKLLPLSGGGVAYHRVGRTAITVGAPLLAREGEGAAMTAFRDHCGSQGWRPLVFQAAAPVAGLESHLIAREAFLDVAAFSLQGSAMANARHSVARAKRDGVVVSWQRWAHCDSRTRAEMVAISRSWRGARPELTFTYGRISDVPNDAWVSVARIPGGRIEAFATWRPLPGGPGLVLDLMRRRDDAVPGAVEALVVAAVELAGSEKMDWVSLGSVAASDNPPRWLRLALASASACGGSGLCSFKDKFRPRWESRYLAVPVGAGVAAVVGLAVAHLRGTHAARRLARPRPRWRLQPAGRLVSSLGVAAALCAFAVGAVAQDSLLRAPETAPLPVAAGASGPPEPSATEISATTPLSPIAEAGPPSTVRLTLSIPVAEPAAEPSGQPSDLPPSPFAPAPPPGLARIPTPVAIAHCTVPRAVAHAEPRQPHREQPDAVGRDGAHKSAPHRPAVAAHQGPAPDQCWAAHRDGEHSAQRH